MHELLALISRIPALRRDINPLPVHMADLQVPARREQIFLLRKARHAYFLHPVFAVGNYTPPLHGRFLFVIPANYPERIYCGLAHSQLHYGKMERHYAVEGHTSLARRQGVLYAGELYFNQCRLVRWTNMSGHYRPPAILRYNLNPHVRELLPEALFKDGTVPPGSDRSSSMSSGSVGARLADFSD